MYQKNIYICIQNKRREYVIHGSKIHIESGYILLTFELSLNRSFDGEPNHPP